MSAHIRLSRVLAKDEIYVLTMASVSSYPCIQLAPPKQGGTINAKNTFFISSAYSGILVTGFQYCVYCATVRPLNISVLHAYCINLLYLRFLFRACIP